MTKYEKEIYELINTSTSHLTVEQIFQRIREKYPAVVLATVYNNLNKLWEAGRIRRMSVEGSPDRYDRIEKHDHLVCKHCGRLSDVTFEDFTAPLREAVGSSFLYYDLKVFYLCPECRKLSEYSAPERSPGIVPNRSGAKKESSGGIDT